MKQNLSKLQVLTGLDRLEQDSSLREKIKGNIGYLCHAASVNRSLVFGATVMKKLFGGRLKKLYGPQHGIVSDVQDNMIESKHFIHPFFKLPVYSLYSETRKPTKEMLEGIDTLVVDLQDVGTRIYTYIYTLTLCMEACAEFGIKIIVLDRPNPIGLTEIEGNILEMKFASFVGRHPIPVRHAMSMAEVALMAQKYWSIKAELEIIEMLNYTREMFFEDTRLPWVLPSPNLATIDAAFVFVGTVVYEGTNVSEGRGSTRALEIIGHPQLRPFELNEELIPKFKKYNLDGFTLRPLYFMPTFQKHMGIGCGGFQIHVTNRHTFKPWRVSELLLQEIYHHLGNHFSWKQPPYEYEYTLMPVDLIHGTDKLRKWVEEKGSYSYLSEIENIGMSDYKTKWNSIKIY